jgi:CRP-like cAMP-binding protein
MFRHAPNDDEFAAIPLFRGLSSKQLSEASRLSTPVEVPAGRVLALEGTAGAEFFILIEGEVEVVQSGERVATRGPGSALGEIALLGSRPRTATLIALTPLRARVASRREFSSLLSAVPEVAVRLEATMAERLAS